jgi:hypothetical protein
MKAGVEAGAGAARSESLMTYWGCTPPILRLPWTWCPRRSGAGELRLACSGTKAQGVDTCLTLTASAIPQAELSRMLSSQ